MMNLIKFIFVLVTLYMAYHTYQTYFPKIENFKSAKPKVKVDHTKTTVRPTPYNFKK